MRTVIQISFLILSGSLFSQTNQIQEIRDHYSYVNSNLRKFKVEKSVEFGESTDGAEIKKYFDDGSLVKVRTEYLGETGKLLRELYVKKGKLIFAFDQKYDYNMPYYIDDQKAKEMGFAEGYDPQKTTLSESRFYFDANKMIRWINPKGKFESVENPEWREKEKYYLMELQELM